MQGFKLLLANFTLLLGVEISAAQSQFVDPKFFTIDHVAQTGRNTLTIQITFKNKSLQTLCLFDAGLTGIYWEGGVNIFSDEGANRLLHPILEFETSSELNGMLKLTKGQELPISYKVDYGDYVILAGNASDPDVIAPIGDYFLDMSLVAFVCEKLDSLDVAKIKVDFFDPEDELAITTSNQSGKYYVTRSTSKPFQFSPIGPPKDFTWTSK